MGTSLLIQQPNVHVEPGESVSTEIRVRNTGTVVDQYSFQPLGDASHWITVDPPIIRLFPDTDATATVRIAPPRQATSRPGQTSWAVKAIPQEDPAGAAVGEGTVEVGHFVDIGAELQPATGRGRLTGRFELAVDNRGNVAVPIRISGSDPEQALDFDISPASTDSQPGTARFAKVTVRPPRRIWRGQPVTHPFQLFIEPQATVAGTIGSADPALPTIQLARSIVLTGTLVQQPILPKWLLKAVLLALAALVALFILWETLLKPSVESAAREVAIEEVAPVSSAVQQLEPAVEQAAAQAAQASEQAEATEQAVGEPDPTDDSGSRGLDTVFNETTRPSNFRIAVEAAVGSSNAASGEANPDGVTFALTDLILQNPGGDVGRIRVLIDGETILESALENFRDLDFHFVSPYVVEPGQAVSIEVDCATNQIGSDDTCSDAVSFSGFATTSTPSNSQLTEG